MVDQHVHQAVTIERPEQGAELRSGHNGVDVPSAQGKSFEPLHATEVVVKRLDKADALTLYTKQYRPLHIGTGLEC